MSGTKRISALTELASTSVAGEDIVAVVDMSQASVADKTKHMKVSSLLGAAASDGKPKVSFKTVAAFIADNNSVVGYSGSGAKFELAEGDIFEAGGFRYSVRATGASDNHVASAGGFKADVLPDDGAVNILAYGVVGDGVTDNNAAWQTAISHCLVDGLELKIPEGTFIIKSHVDEIYLNQGMTADYQGLTFSGAGRGKTIIKEIDGASEAAEAASAGGGRFVTMFYCWLADPATRGYKYGSFTFRDITFDKNARSNTAPGGFSAYDWEGAHVIKFQGSGTVGAGTITASVDAVTFERIEIIDKLGAGIVLGPAACPVRSLVLRDIQSTRHPSIDVNGGDFGQKGCIEVAIDSDLTTYESVQCLYSQIEPTNTYDADRKVEYKLTNCAIDTFEFTFLPGANNGQSNVFIDIANLTCKDKYLSRGCRVQISNSRLKMTSEIYDVHFKAVNTTFLLPYNDSTYVVTPMYFNRPVAFTFSPINELIGCQWLIDADTVDATTTGYAMRSNLTTTLPAIIRVIGGAVDPRIYGVCDPYSAGGDWTFIGTRAAARSGARAFLAGASSTWVTKLRLIDVDFSAVVGDWVRVQQAATGYTLEISGVYDATLFKFATNNAALVLAAQFPIKPTLIGTAAPASGTWFVGQRVVNPNATIGTATEWQNTVAGAPGTWRMVRQAGTAAGATGSRPTPAAIDIGLTYLDTTLDADGKPIWWNGTAWVDATGATV